MSREVVRAGFDAWVRSSYPSERHPSEARLALREGSHFSYFWMRSPAPVGATVTNAKLVLFASGSSSGSRTVSVFRTTDQWFMGTLNWNNRPGVQTPGRSTSIGNLVDHQRIEVDVTPIVQAWASGAPNYGFTVRTSATTVHYVSGLSSGWKPVLEVEWSDAPATPTDLAPSEAATGVTHPHVTFTYLDVSGNTELEAVRVQANTTASWGSPLFDSGVVETSEAGLDLAETTFPGLTEGVPMFWRVRAMDGAGLWSSWSAAVTMTYEPKPSVTVTNLDDGLIYDPSPVIIWDSSGAIVKHQVIAEDMVTSKRVYQQPQTQGDPGSHTIPFGYLKDDRQYRITVRVWDALHREATPGDHTFAFDSRVVLLSESDVVGWVPTLSAAQVGETPRVELTWTRNDTPDQFVILCDGEPVRRVEAADVFVSGTTYKVKMNGARPNWEHSWRVRAVVNNVQSTWSPPAVFATRVEGIWLYGGVLGEVETEAPDGAMVTLWGDDGGSWEQEDDASVYTPIGSSRVVRVINGMRGLQGTLSGHIADGFGSTIEEAERLLYVLKENPTRTFRVAVGDQAMTVLAGNIRVSPSPRTRKGNNIRDVEFDFWDVSAQPYGFVS